MLYVYKCWTVEALDKFLGTGDLAANHQFSIDLLDDPSFETLTDVTRQIGDRLPGINPGDAAGQYETGWIEALPEQEVDNIMRKAYRKALELATTTSEPRPIETFWITGTSDNFEMHVATSPSRVTVFVFIPGATAEDYHGSRIAESETWAFRSAQDEGQKVSGTGSDW